PRREGGGGAVPRAGEGDARQMTGMRGWLSACSRKSNQSSTQAHSVYLPVSFGAWMLSFHVRLRVSLSTQTWSCGVASRQTSPRGQFSFGLVLLSFHAWARVAGLTQTWSSGVASLHTVP